MHFAACPGRVFGYDAGGGGDAGDDDDGGDDGLAAAVTEIAHRAGVGVARRRTVAALERASGGGHTIVVDASPCARHLAAHGAPVVDLATWLLRDVVPNVELRRLARPVTVHVPCSARLAGLEETFLEVARACADEVLPTPDALCCGQAGDRGFALPELPAAALAGVAGRLPGRCREGYSASRTCEIALALHAGRPYRSLAHLVRDAARAATAL